MIEPYLANAAASYHQRQAERDLRAARSTLATSGGSTRVSDLTTQVRACTSNLAGCLSPAQLLQTNAIDPAWEATIATDRAQQHTLPQQRPFSDSYAQGKPPAKRQKVIHEDSTPSQVFSSLFRQAVDNSNALPDGTSFSGTCLLARWYLSTLRALLSVNPRWRRLSSCHEIGRGGQGDCTGRAVPPPGSERSAQLGGQQSRLPAGALPAHATTHSRRGTHHLDDRHEHEHEQHGIERMMSERHLQRTVTI